ncbi:MAG: hypothetical protein ABIS51_22250 [Sphingomonas sp.]
MDYAAYEALFNTGDDRALVERGSSYSPRNCSSRVTGTRAITLISLMFHAFALCRIIMTGARDLRPAVHQRLQIGADVQKAGRRVTALPAAHVQCSVQIGNVSGPSSYAQLR